MKPYRITSATRLDGRLHLYVQEVGSTTLRLIGYRELDLNALFSTPSLEVYRKMEAEDPNVFWRIDCGHHQNLLDAALEATTPAGGGRLMEQRIKAVEAAEEILTRLNGENYTLDEVLRVADWLLKYPPHTYTQLHPNTLSYAPYQTWGSSGTFVTTNDTDRVYGESDGETSP